MDVPALGRLPAALWAGFRDNRTAEYRFNCFSSGRNPVYGCWDLALGGQRKSSGRDWRCDEENGSDYPRKGCYAENFILCCAGSFGWPYPFVELLCVWKAAGKLRACHGGCAGLSDSRGSALCDAPPEAGTGFVLSANES